jgi:hypothetical protein
MAKLERRFLGRTGLRVSSLTLGAMNFGGLRFSPEELARIDAISPPGDVIVPFYKAEFAAPPHRW